MLNLFRKRERAPKPELGDFRIVRTESAGGEVWFVIERFGDGWGSSSPETWSSTYHACVGPHMPWHRSFELANAALEKWQQEQRDRKTVSETVVWPAPHTGEG